MTRRLIRVACGSLAVATFLIACSTVLAAPLDGMKVEVVGLQISKPLPTQPKKDDRFLQMPTGSMFGSVGTHVHFLVTDPQRAVLSVDHDDSKVTVRDDKGNDLAAEQAGDSRFRARGRPLSTSEARESGGTILKVEQPNAPGRGATKLILDGEVALRCGIGEVVVEREGVALKTKTAIKAGPTEFAIGEVEDQDFGDVKLAITFKSNKPLDAIIDIEFLDADGKPIEQQNMGSFNFSGGGFASYSRQIGLHKKVDKATLRIKHYKSIETVKLPLDMEIDVGF